jgi:hypothetical protein
MDIALDPDANSTFLFYHAHVDYAVHRFLVPFVEIGGMTYVDGGDGSTDIRLRGGSEVPLGVAQSVLNQDPEEGYDYANLGSSSMAGHTVVAGSVGVRVPITKHIIFGAAYEYPLSPSRDVLRQRAQAQLTIEF